MGLDYGDNRIGVAVSDPFGWTAQGIETITCKNGTPNPIGRIRELVKQYNISRIVVGFPLNMNGTVGPRGEKTQQFIDLLVSELNIEVVKWDERLTTAAAHRTMRESGKKPSRNKGLVDKIAAVYILQSYLDSLSQ